jgi:hypothetical protein
MTDKELRVSKIRNGTVIDHVTAGQALNVLAILGIDGSGGESVSIGMNVPSDKLGSKDVVKVEGRELSQSEVDDQHHPRVRGDREKSGRAHRLGDGHSRLSEPQLHHER